MHRIDTPSAQKDKFGLGKNGFTNGDPLTGTPATSLNSDIWDALQEELCRVIEGAGMRLDKRQHEQLYQAIKTLAQQEANQKLTKKDNGADIPDKPQFIKNIGLVDVMFPVGMVIWFNQNKDPNSCFAGTRWQYIGENKTIRLAKQDGSDVFAEGGTDSLTLTTEHLPAHSHHFSAQTDSFDYGNKQTHHGGGHSHEYRAVDVYNDVSDSGSGHPLYRTDQQHTTHAGEHTHTTPIGPHHHTVSGTTDTTGRGAEISIINRFITLMAWYRVG